MAEKNDLTREEIKLISSLKDLFENQVFCFYLDEVQNLSRFGGYIPSLVVKGLQGRLALTIPLVDDKIFTFGEDQAEAIRRIILMNEYLGLAETDVARLYQGAGITKKTN
ncbi:MAG: hypothetical protein OEZ33_09030 [Gammaproteobacteria bacterium]|nr:hypothetical protein [Gammaproteobacteria bacterium]